MNKGNQLYEALSPHDRTPAPVAATVPDPPTKTPPACRAGKKALTTYHDPAVSKQLKQLALDLDRESIQSLVEEALNDLFQKYRRPTIA